MSVSGTAVAITAPWRSLTPRTSKPIGELSMTVPTPPGARQVARAREYITRVTGQLPPRRRMTSEFLALVGHATALLTVIDAGAVISDTPEVGARRVLASAVLGDFTREAQAFADGGQVPDWLAWSHRMAQALGGLLNALQAAQVPPGGREAFQAAATGAGSGVAPDGSGRLSPADLLVVLGALEDGAAWARIVGGRDEDAAAYRALSQALGDDS